MKSDRIVLLPENLPSSIKNFVGKAIENPQVHLILYTHVKESTLNFLTLILAKDTNENVMNALQAEVCNLNAFSKYQTLISINTCNTLSIEKYVHFSFLQLHLHPKDVIYADNSKRWNSLFQNVYATKKENALARFKKHTQEVQEKVLEAITNFVKPLAAEQDYENAHKMLLNMFSYHVDVLKNMLLPKVLHHHFNEQQFLELISKYYPQFSRTLKRIDAIKKSHFVNDAHCLITPSPELTFDKWIQRVVALQTHFMKKLNVFYQQKLEVPIAEAPESDTVLLQKLALFLSNYLKLDAVYILGKKSNSNPEVPGSCCFNLLLLSTKVKVQQHDVIAQHVAKHFKGKIEVCCLIHNSYWLQKNQQVMQGFISDYLVSKNRIYLKQGWVHNNEVFISQKNADVLLQKNNYSQERLNYITPCFLAFQQANLVYQVGHIVLLKNMFQHLVLALLYQRMHYVPDIFSCLYLMQLLKAFLPEVYQKCITTNNVKNILALLSTPILYLPQKEQVNAHNNQEVFAQALCLCEKLFNEIQITNN